MSDFSSGDLIIVILIAVAVGVGAYKAGLLKHLIKARTPDHDGGAAPAPASAADAVPVAVVSVAPQAAQVLSRVESQPQAAPEVLLPTGPPLPLHPGVAAEESLVAWAVRTQAVPTGELGALVVFAASMPGIATYADILAAYKAPAANAAPVAQPPDPDLTGGEYPMVTLRPEDWSFIYRTILNGVPEGQWQARLSGPRLLWRQGINDAAIRNASFQPETYDNRLRV